MDKIKIRDYTCGLSVVIVGLGLYSYYVREVLASLALFSAAFFIVAALALATFAMWHVGAQATGWVRSNIFGSKTKLTPASVSE